MYSPSFFLLSQQRRARPCASVPSGERIDKQVANEEWLATRKMEERHQLEMPLPGDRRKEFVISSDTAMFVAPNPIQREASSLLFAAPDLYSIEPRCDRQLWTMLPSRASCRHNPR
jgi:hypothetical protein